MRLLLSAVMLSLVSASVAARPGPQEVAQAFYAARLESKDAGLPSGRELADFSGYLGPELVCVMGAALRYEDRFSQANPDDKPPFPRNDLYSSGPGIPTRFTLGKLELSGAKATLPVHFYADTPDTQDANGWEDILQLKNVRGRRWQIANIEYHSDVDGSNKGNLYENLRKTLLDAPKVTGWSSHELDSCVMDVVPARGHRTASTKSHGKKHHRAAKAHGTSKNVARKSVTKGTAKSKAHTASKSPARPSSTKKKKAATAHPGK
jgi:hypothetical protein